MSNHKSHMKMKRARGGRTVYSGAGSNVVKEAEEKKSGGKVTGFVAGAKGKHRVARKSGGRVGSDKNPFSSAHRG